MERYFDRAAIKKYYVISLFLIISLVIVRSSAQRQPGSGSSNRRQQSRINTYATTTELPWAMQRGGFHGLAGTFCSKLPAAQLCCERAAVTRRSDNRCAVPIAGTECYCDQHCDRHGPHPAASSDPSGRSYFDYGDCCPDYWSYCNVRRIERTASISASVPARWSGRSSPRNNNNNNNNNNRPDQLVADYDEEFQQRFDDNGDERLEDEQRSSAISSRIAAKSLEAVESNDFCTVRTRDGLQHVRVGESARLNCNDCSCRQQKLHAYNSAPPELICTQHLCLIEPLLVDEVNANYPTYGWQASNYTPYWGRTLKWGVKRRLGTYKPKLFNEKSVSGNLTWEKVPDSFDARDRWPRLLSAVIDQGACGASWAYGTVQTAQDRYNIGKLQHQQQRGGSRGASAPIQLSVEQLVACDSKRSQHGCRGGSVEKAWAYVARQGVVVEHCYPTEIDWLTTLGSSINSGAGDDDGKRNIWTPNCKIGRRQQSGMLEFECPNNMGGRETHAAHRYTAQSVETFYQPNEADIQTLIMRYGPVQAVIRVRPDFFMYSDGVYSFTDHLERSLLEDKYAAIDARGVKHMLENAHHAVRIVGWGVDYSSGKPIKFWECANSWGTWWGREGYFRISRGSSPAESDIETFIVNAHVERKTSNPHKTSSLPADTVQEQKQQYGDNYDTEHDFYYQNDVPYEKVDETLALQLTQQENEAVALLPTKLVLTATTILLAWLASNSWQRIQLQRFVEFI